MGLSDVYAAAKIGPTVNLVYDSAAVYSINLISQFETSFGTRLPSLPALFTLNASHRCYLRLISRTNTNTTITNSDLMLLAGVYWPVLIDIRTDDKLLVKAVDSITAGSGRLRITLSSELIRGDSVQV